MPVPLLLSDCDGRKFESPWPAMLNHFVSTLSEPRSQLGSFERFVFGFILIDSSVLSDEEQHLGGEALPSPQLVVIQS